MKTLIQTVRNVAALCLLANLPAVAATDYWLGGVSSGNWNSGVNWVAGTAPQPFDALVFTNQSGAVDTANNNFTAGTSFDGITFSNSSAGSTITLTGSSVLLSGNTNGILIGVTNCTALAETVNNNLTLDWGYHMFYSPVFGSTLNHNGAIRANVGGIADFGTTNVDSTSYVLDGSGLIAGLGGAGLTGNNGLGSVNSGGGFTALATVVGGMVTNYTYPAAQVIAAAGNIGADDTTTLTTGFAAGTISDTTLLAQEGTPLSQEATTLTTGFATTTVVTSIAGASAAGITTGQFFQGTGVPNGVTVTSVTGTTIGVSSFTSTAASGAGNYTFTTGFNTPTVVTSIVVASATGITTGQFFQGTGVPAGVTVTSIVGTTIGVSSFTSTAASGAGAYTFTTGFASGTVVTSVVVSNATGIAVGQVLQGTGVPAGVTVGSVTGTTIGVSSFTSTAASGAGNYTFGSAVSSVVVTSATGITAGDAFLGAGVPSGVTVTSVAGTTVNLSTFTPSAASSGSYIFASSAADPQNIEITPTTGNFSLAGGTSSTYGSSQTFINTILATSAGTTKITSLVIPSGNGTLVLGSTNAGTGMYVGGIYLPGSTTAQLLVVGGGNSTFITSGPMSGVNAVPGEIVIGLNGNNTSNEGEMNAAIKDNLSGGKVSAVYIGSGSYYVNNSGNTYSGGTYMLKGRLQCNALAALGYGPVYIEGGDAEISLQNVPVGVMTNAFFLSPGCSSVESGTEGALRLSGTAGNEYLTNTITLMGNPVTPGTVAGTTPATIGDRINGQAPTAFTTFAGQITGTGTLEFFASSGTSPGETFLVSNVTANANNWTGGLIIDEASGDNSNLKILANNQLGGNTLTLIQAGAGFARLDLNGFNDTIGGLSGPASTLNQVANLGSAPSILTVGAGNATSTFGGVIGGDSAPNTLSVTKIGAGTLTLNNANTYQGNTLVEGGTLALSGSGSLATPQITVSNATFDVSALSSYAGTTPIGMTNGTLNLGTVLATAVGSLSFSNSTLQFVLNPSTPGINVSGTLATGGSTNVIKLTSVAGFASYPQQIPLIKYGSPDPNLVDVNNNLTSLGVSLPALGNPVGYLTNNTVNGSIDLVLTAGPVPVVPITWNGQTNGVNVSTWDILTTPDWVTTSGRTPYLYQNTSMLTFDDTAAGPTTVNLNTMVLPGGITFNNTNKNYTLAGSGTISGAMGLTNNGGGLVTLAEAGGDNYSGGITANGGTLVVDNNSGGVSGGTTINAGTVQLGNNDANGVLPAGSLTDNGALVFNRSDTALSVAGIIAGTGALIDNGGGTVTLTGIDPFTGSVTVNAGTLAVSGPNGTTSTISTSTNATINNSGTLLVEADNSLGNTTTALPVTINAGGVLTGAASSATAGDAPGTGTSSHLRGLLTLAGGTLAMNGISTATHGSWDLDGGVTVPGASTSSTISALNVVPSQGGGTQFNVTNGTSPSGIDLFVSGTFNNDSAEADAGIIKNGPGVMNLDNNNSYSHGTTINGGVLQLGLPGDTAALTSPAGSGTVTINTSSVLEFNSSKGVTVPGAIADDGTGTVLANGGTNILTGANTYGGPTIVNGGTLALQGAGAINGSTSITVSNATLDVSLSSSPVTDSGSLSLTNSTLNVGTNFISSIGSLAVSNTTLIFPASQISSDVNVTGAFVTGGTTNRIKITLVPGLPAFPTNITLIKYGSFTNVDANNNLVTLGLILPTVGSPAGYLTNNVGNSSIDLVVLSDSLVPIYPLTWNGQTNGVNVGAWNILATPDWLQSSVGVTPYEFQNTSPVTFDDTAAGTTNVILTTNVQPASLTLNNASLTYTFSGPGSISGITGINMLNTGTAKFTETGGDAFSGGVTVGGGGTLILSNANVNISGGLTINGASLIDQHGGTETGNLNLNGGFVLLDQAGSINGNANINAGTVQVGTNDANGSLPTGTATVSDTLVFDRGDSALNVASVIAGGGTLENNGAGTVTLSAIETFTGQVMANAGTLAIINSVNGNPDGISRAGGLTINTNATVMFESDNAGFGTGTSGSVPVTINAGGTLTGFNGTGGTSSHIPGSLTLNGGNLAMGGPTFNTANGSWDLYTGVSTAGGQFTSLISAQYVIPTQVGGTTFNIPAGTTPGGIDLLVTGTLVNGTGLHDTGIILTGGGTMALDNNNTYALGTTINAGTMQLGAAGDTNAWTSPLGGGAVTINNAGSTLLFAGSIGATVNNQISDDNNSDALVLVSRGTNILGGVDTYTAPTIVSNGTLLVNGSLAAASTMTILNGTLGGSGTVGGGVTNNGTIAPGSTTAIGTLTCSSDVTNIGATTLVMKLNPSLSPSNDVLNVGGGLNCRGTLNVLSLGGIYAGGDTFTLFKAAGGLSGTFSATNLPALSPGLAWVTTNLANGVLSVLATVNTTPTNLVATVSGNTLSLTWPADHTGWRLLVQTNPLSVGLISASNAWSTVTGSTTVDTENVTLNRTNGTVFYRLVYP